jgi:hypothetical protein
MRKRWLLVVTAAALSAGCSAGAAPPPFTPVVDTKALMNTVIDPTTDIIWDSVKTIITAEGIEEIRPQNEEEWTAVRNAAVIVAESGNLLMMVPRARDGGDWMRASQAMIDSGRATMKAAEAKDADKVFELGGVIYNACTNCHAKYALGLERVSD